MPRSVRHEYAGAVYHVMCRGNNGQSIFEPARLSAGEASQAVRGKKKGWTATVSFDSAFSFCFGQQWTPNLTPNSLIFGVAGRASSAGEFPSPGNAGRYFSKVWNPGHAVYGYYRVQLGFGTRPARCRRYVPQGCHSLRSLLSFRKPLFESSLPRPPIPTTTTTASFP